MFKYIPSGDSSVIVKAGREISADINRTVRKLLVRIENENIEGLIDLIPSYTELMICYDPSVICIKKLLDTLRSFENNVEDMELPDSSIIQIPVLYGGAWGPDLQEVARLNNLSAEEVIKIHISVKYLVYMLGFTPGFCYLGGLDLRIATPRKETPRINIPAGAVGIADKQTGIYPVESPGGWQLIGNSPLRLFDPFKKPEFLINAGDYIHFYPVDEDQYKNIQAEVKEGIYQVKKTLYN
jgi:inhibitor of KinA